MDYEIIVKEDMSEYYDYETMSKDYLDVSEYEWKTSETVIFHQSITNNMEAPSGSDDEFLVKVAKGGFKLAYMAAIKELDKTQYAINNNSFTYSGTENLEKNTEIKKARDRVISVLVKFNIPIKK